MPEQPLLLSMALVDAPVGASSLNNSLFMTDFDLTHSAMPGYVQIQFDQDFMRPGRGFAVADAHGTIDASFLHKAKDIFQFFVVHMRFADLNSEAHRHDISQILEGARTRCVIILGRDAPSAAASATGNFSHEKLVVLPVPDLTNQNSEQSKVNVNRLRK
ncbi:unnamed protein product [Symbiodinium natans]|uniref:Uncharacterized protein n=1 Tax=Symbiodinium natans TaxID=878477 RepID=A0A812UU81_9DINO|nr:unnamed protein product [Symbiodinium natans]